MVSRILLLLVVLGLVRTGSAQDRFALVIGNGKYPGGAALNNPANDAAAVATALEKLDFKVTKKIDVDLGGMEDAAAAFCKSLNKRSVAVFFYAGHGLQVKGENYLVPLDAEVKEESQVKRKCYPVEELLAELDSSNAALKIVILDSCRDNPLTRSGKRSAESGLASIGRIPHGTIIAFSTAPGETALDGRGANSPFTKHLVASLDRRPTQGLEVIQALRSAGQAVSKEFGQRPWLNFDTSLEDFFLWRDAKGVAEPPPPPERPLPPLLSGVDDVRASNELYTTVTGDTTDPIYGTEVYTTDSYSATTAVHAGVLKPGETGLVRLIYEAGRESYSGSQQNGVTSRDWGSYPRSYRIELAPTPDTARTYDVKASAGGPVWGSDIYTADSDLASAVIHAGLLKDGEAGKILVTYLEGRDAYETTTRNGVTSLPYVNFPLSMRLQRVAGQRFYAVTGATDGLVYGTEVYSADSSPATAAVHAGLLKPGEPGLVRLILEAGRERYPGSKRNGVTSHDWGRYTQSYRIELAPKPDSKRIVEVKAAVGGLVWGSDIYTADSDLAAAVIHAGLLKDGEAGKIQVTYLAGRASYAATSRNGVTSRTYAEFPLSMKLERATGR